jgi:hypothetical protein
MTWRGNPLPTTVSEPVVGSIRTSVPSFPFVT